MKNMIRLTALVMALGFLASSALACPMHKGKGKGQTEKPVEASESQE